MTHYFLPQHVYFCVHGDALIFLNLKTDKYLAVSGQPAISLQTVCGESEIIGTSPAQLAPDCDVKTHEKSLGELISKGLLTTQQHLGKPIAPTETALPELELLEPAGNCRPRLRFLHLWNFYSACNLAVRHLRSRPIEHTIRDVAERKALAGSRRDFDIKRTRELVSVFNKLRSYFPRKYLCLFDSLALIEFLARYGHFPTWVFAIKVEPWAAHCWVQDGEVLFNEELEHARDFIPIMTV